MGRAGVAAARLLINRGARVTITDRKEGPGLSRAFRELEGLDIELVPGGHPFSLLEGRELVVVSPGVPPDIPLLQKAREEGIVITGEFELASSFLKSPVIAVTGTNGKTTTATLIGEILNKEGKVAVVAGNTEVIRPCRCARRTPPASACERN